MIDTAKRLTRVAPCGTTLATAFGSDHWSVDMLRSSLSGVRVFDRTVPVATKMCYNIRVQFEELTNVRR